MAWYCVSYDLRREVTSADYQRMQDAIDALATDWCKPLLSHWIVESDLRPRALIARLLGSGALDENDGVIVLEITGYGDFRKVSRAEGVVEWLRGRLVRV